MTFSVVMPIHNEEKHLPYSLPSVFTLNPHELHVTLDHCSDRSEDLIRKMHAKLGGDTTLTLNHFSGETGYRYRPAYLRRTAYKQCHNDIILNTSADLILDPKIGTYQKLIDDEIKLIDLGFLDYPYNVQCFLHRLYDSLGLAEFSGLYIFDRRALLGYEDEEELRGVWGEDQHLQEAVRRRFKAIHVDTRSLHLRAREGRVEGLERGARYWTEHHTSPLRALVGSVLMLRPETYVGYRIARRTELG